MIDQDTYDAGTPEAYAYAIGLDHGHSAASWLDIDDTDTALAIYCGLRDGDPAAYDALPCADLSGTWADSLTGPSLLKDAMPYATDEERMDAFDDVCTAYELGYSEALEHDATRLAARVLLGAPDWRLQRAGIVWADLLPYNA